MIVVVVMVGAVVAVAALVALVAAGVTLVVCMCMCIRVRVQMSVIMMREAVARPGVASWLIKESGTCIAAAHTFSLKFRVGRMRIFRRRNRAIISD